MRNISASLTADQIIESVKLVAAGGSPVKDVTRRLGWANLKVGERLQVCKKCMGRKPGEPLEKLAVIEVVSAYRQTLSVMLDDLTYGRDECRREGFPELSREEQERLDKLGGPAGSRRVINGNPRAFVNFFCATHKGCTPGSTITRIEFKYVVPAPNPLIIDDFTKTES
jgi:hypothetical protein